MLSVPKTDGRVSVYATPGRCIAVIVRDGHGFNEPPDGVDPGARTRTPFVMETYKDRGIEFEDEDDDERLSVSP